MLIGFKPIFKTRLKTINKMNIHHFPLSKIPQNTVLKQDSSVSLLCRRMDIVNCPWWVINWLCSALRFLLCYWSELFIVLPSAGLQAPCPRSAALNREWKGMEVIYFKDVSSALHTSLWISKDLLTLFHQLREKIGIVGSTHVPCSNSGSAHFYS